MHTIPSDNTNRHSIIFSSRLGKKSEAITAYRNARQLYQAMALDAKVQDCDNAIEALNSTM